jgi:hypothetical protein
VVRWRNGKAPSSEEMYKTYLSFSDLSIELTKLQARANSLHFGDIQIEAAVIYERIFENLNLLGVSKINFIQLKINNFLQVSEALIEVTRSLALEGKTLVRLLLGVIDGGCRSFEDRVLNTNDDLRDGRFEEVPGDYIDFYERDSPIQNAFEGLIPMANTTLNFLEESTLAAIEDLVHNLFLFIALIFHFSRRAKIVIT